ncbi:MAG: hypothetical protein A2096_00185 [Spirochaetes bacterium GWF1_41_5]|nr:MAG: hypothetical protein A2096_00185 [Spirochaetes bacterium GWF1_41_5]
MSDKDHNIHDFDVALICEYFSSMDRQGPGSREATIKASWFTEERPKEIFDFWNEAYPEIDTISNKIDQMQKAGYVVTASFILPEVCWIENFFKPGITAQKAFLAKYRGNKSAEEFIKYEKHHALLYDKYKEYYGYVFYIGKKI